VTNTAFQQKSKRRNYLDGGDTAGVLDQPLNEDDPVPEPTPIQIFPATSGNPSWLSRLDSGAMFKPMAAPTEPLAPLDNPLSDFSPNVPNQTFVQQKAQNVADIANTMPQRGTPKWWERLAAGAAGALSGISNAAGRIRQPINIAAEQENILHPGYANKLEQWRDRLIPAETALELAGQQVTAGQKAQEAAATVEHLKAEAQMALGQGRTTITVTPEMEQASEGRLKANMVVPVTAWIAEANNIAGRWAANVARANAAPKEQDIAVTDPEIASERGWKLGQMVPISVYNTAINAHARTTTPRNPAPISDELLRMRAAGAKTGNAEVDAMTPAQAKEARKPPPAASQVFPMTPAAPGPPTPGAPPRLSQAFKNGQSVISDGNQWWPLTSPTGQRLAKELGQ
jgi:hypothetical protein